MKLRLSTSLVLETPSQGMDQLDPQPDHQPRPLLRHRHHLPKLVNLNGLNVEGKCLFQAILSCRTSRNLEPAGLAQLLANRHSLASTSMIGTIRYDSLSDYLEREADFVPTVCINWR